MAVGLQNFPNIFPPDGDYLSGRIKDDNGDGIGTPINQMTNGDIQEFFARLMKYAGITPNGLPDSEYTGHQLIQALTKRIFYRASKPLIEALIGGYTTNDLITIDGVIVTITNSGNTATWTKGHIYYNDITYIVDAGTLTKSTGSFIFVISDSDDFKISISSGTGGLGLYNSAKQFGYWTSTNVAVTGGTASGASFKYKIIGKTCFVTINIECSQITNSTIMSFPLPAGIIPKNGTAGAAFTPDCVAIGRVIYSDNTDQNIFITPNAAGKIDISTHYNGYGVSFNTSSIFSLCLGELIFEIV